MNPTKSAPVGGGTHINPPVLPSTGHEPHSVNESSIAPNAGPRRFGYGLPCAKCRTYYPADLPACPVCQSAERVSPVVALKDAPPSETPESTDGLILGEAALEEERERFLREFQSQLYAESIRVPAASAFRCSRPEDHIGAFEPAEVCQDCYISLRQRADLAEAALHIDLNDATQIIYDAVWADPGNPGKTYQNAAQALIAEIRRRAGISAVMGTFKTLAD